MEPFLVALLVHAAIGGANAGLEQPRRRMGVRPASAPG